MSDYTRSTRECVPAQLKPELLQAIRAYSAQHNPGDIETGVRPVMGAAASAVVSR